MKSDMEIYEKVRSEWIAENIDNLLVDLNECLDEPVSPEELLHVLNMAQGEIYGLICRYRATQKFLEKIEKLQEKYPG